MYVFSKISLYANSYLWIYVEPSGMPVNLSFILQVKLFYRSVFFGLTEASTNGLL